MLAARTPVLQTRKKEWYDRLFYLLASAAEHDVGPHNFFASMKLMDGYPRTLINDVESIMIGGCDEIHATGNGRREEKGNMCAVKIADGTHRNCPDTARSRVPYAPVPLSQF